MFSVILTPSKDQDEETDLRLSTIAANKEAMDGAVLAVQSELDNMYTFNKKNVTEGFY